jgi:P63C domain
MIKALSMAPQHALGHVYLGAVQTKRTARPTALLSTSKLWRWTGIWPLHTVGSVSPSIAAEKAAKLIKQYGRIAQQAHIIVGASAKAGIKGLVYALAGYNPTADEVIAAFKFYVREEARDYEREFPNQLYQEWYRLCQLPEPERNKPWKFKHLTVNHVYWPLADSKGNILELTRAQRANGGQERKRLHQFLSDIGVKALRQHLGQLLGIAQVSRDRQEYEGHVKRSFGQQYEMDLG